MLRWSDDSELSERGAPSLPDPDHQVATRPYPGLFSNHPCFPQVPTPPSRRLLCVPRPPLIPVSATLVSFETLDSQESATTPRCQTMRPSSSKKSSALFPRTSTPSSRSPPSSPISSTPPSLPSSNSSSSPSVESSLCTYSPYHSEKKGEQVADLTTMFCAFWTERASFSSRR